MRVRFPRIAFLFACAVSLALPLAAQSTNGAINGLVLDPSNKVIGGADILIINDATGIKYPGKTNEDGIYVVPNLPPGQYRLQVSKVGFKTLIKPDIVLNIQDALSINFTLPVGAVFETVTVEGGASMVNTTDASVSTVVDQAYVKNMPLNGRSFQDLILLTPGVVTQSPQNSTLALLGQTGEFSVNGQRQESNNYTVDGVSANVGATPGINMIIQAGASGSVPVATVLGTTQALVSVDDLQEFRVQTSTYSSEYGRNPGGQFAFETKSGTNKWHGTAYDYLRNGFFDAQDWFNDYFGTPNPALRQNDFGGTLGGPVTIPGLYSGKDKTFFFVSYEGLRLTQPQASTPTFVPDAALRAAAPSPLNQVLNAFPVPNGPDDVTNGVAQFIGTWSNPASLDSKTVRLDHVVNDKSRLFFRFGDTPSSSTSRNSSGFVGGPPSLKQISANTARTYTAGATSLFTNRLSNQFRMNYSSNEATGHSVNDSFGGSVPVSLVQLTGVPTGGQPTVALNVGGHFIPLTITAISSLQRQWNFVDTADFSSGRHHLKFGMDYRRLTPIATPPNPGITYIYSSKSAVQNNNALLLAVAQAPAYPLYVNFSAFAQDEWKVSQRLSLSMGLRWDVNPAPGVTKGLMPYTVQGSSPNTWALAPQGTPLWQTTRFNLAPRLGVAYLLHSTPGFETVVRGGGGVFFDTGQQVGSLGFDGPGFQAINITSASFPAAVAPPVIVNPPPAPYGFSLPNVFPAHLQLPYTIQWNASIEQGLGKSQAFTLSYVGSHAGRLLTSQSISTPTNPNSTSWNFTSNGLTSDYDALQTQFQRRLSRGLTALASYTWSHCIDFGSQNYTLAVQRGNCGFDVRNNFSAAFSYDLPHLGQNTFAKAVLHNWGVDDRLIARTSFPVPLDGSLYFDPLTGQLLTSGLDLVSGQPIYLYGANCASVLQGLGELQPGQGCPGGRAINPTAFATVPTDPNTGNPLRQGTAPRNFVRGFGAWQMNFAVRRDFPIHERLKLQFRAEAFNLFNHPNFGTINSTYCSGVACTFGQFTGTLASSLGGTLNPLYQMGGPRSMQFALKVVF